MASAHLWPGEYTGLCRKCGQPWYAVAPTLRCAMRFRVKWLTRIRKTLKRER